MTSPDLVQRLYDRLLVALAGEGENAGVVTIGDIYQRLIPYRAVRSEVGVMELASYEHALLQLLAGEGDLVRVAGETAAVELRREVASPNPILGIYRDYADVSVSIPAATAAGPEAPGSPKVDLPESAAPSSGEGAAYIPEVSRPEANHSTKATTPPAEAREHQGTAASLAPCTGCGKDLPAVEDLRFCPFCGRARERAPCAECGAHLELDWSFCIRCGVAAPL